MLAHLFRQEKKHRPLGDARGERAACRRQGRTRRVSIGSPVPTGEEASPFGRRQRRTRSVSKTRANAPRLHWLTCSDRRRRRFKYKL
ncbi:MAG: hypothetical protein KME30_03170 [Iphinoe sp. HA4291-MV1]|nr:hypothetical protein [Iphinoe sp. HA4291-MV1]